jgi:flagellar FliL protein
MSVAPAAEAAEEAAAEAPKSSRKRTLLIAAPVALAVAAGGLWFSGMLPRPFGGHEAAPKEAGAAAERPAPVFVELPEVIANLNGNPRRPSYIKVRPRLEVAHADDVARVQAAMPRLLDMFQTYLREMRPEELRGSAGTYRLREELIARASIAAAPARVTDVLFTEMLIQ